MTPKISTQYADRDEHKFLCLVSNESVVGDNGRMCAGEYVEFKVIGKRGSVIVRKSNLHRSLITKDFSKRFSVMLNSLVVVWGGDKDPTFDFIVNDEPFRLSPSSMERFLNFIDFQI